MYKRTSNWVTKRTHTLLQSVRQRLLHVFHNNTTSCSFLALNALRKHTCVLRRMRARDVFLLAGVSYLCSGDGSANYRSEPLAQNRSRKANVERNVGRLHSSSNAAPSWSWDKCKYSRAPWRAQLQYRCRIVRESKENGGRSRGKR